MIEIYHGNGKGKTTAAIGIAVRAVGNGLPVIFAQFLKDGTSAEVEILKSLPGMNYLTADVFNGFAFRMTEMERVEQAESYLRMMDRIERMIPKMMSLNRPAKVLMTSEECGASKAYEDARAAAKVYKAAESSQKNDNESKAPAGAMNASESGIGRPYTDVPVKGLIVLDEALHAVRLHMLSEERLLAFLDGVPRNVEVVITGWAPTDALREKADYITEFRKEKHPFDLGIPARPGVEF